MKSCLLGLLLIAAASLPAEAGTVRFSAPVPFYIAVPEETLLRLSAEPLNGGWAEEVKGADATEAVLVQYQPAEGERIILFSAYCFPADVWDAAQKPDEPPPSEQKSFARTAWC